MFVCLCVCVFVLVCNCIDFFELIISFFVVFLFFRSQPYLVQFLKKLIPGNIIYDATQYTVLPRMDGNDIGDSHVSIPYFVLNLKQTFFFCYFKVLK